MNNIDIKKIVLEIIPIAIRKKWSEKWTKKLIDVVVPTNVPKLLVKFIIAAQVGKVFCECVHVLEGKNSL